MASVLAELRSLIPKRPLTFSEGNRLAALQAERLLRLSDVHHPAVPEQIICDLPRISVEREYPFKVSGVTTWAEGVWMIALNAGEPETRQRFSLAHEFKHVLDAPFKAFLYPTQLGFTGEERYEAVADTFAANLLMPKTWIKKAWYDGVQDVRQLARMFDVSAEAMRIRLRTLGLLAPVPRCGVAVA